MPYQNKRTLVHSRQYQSKCHVRCACACKFGVFLIDCGLSVALLCITDWLTHDSAFVSRSVAISAYRASDWQACASTGTQKQICLCAPAAVWWVCVITQCWPRELCYEIRIDWPKALTATIHYDECECQRKICLSHALQCAKGLRQHFSFDILERSADVKRFSAFLINLC